MAGIVEGLPYVQALTVGWREEFALRWEEAVASAINASLIDLIAEKVTGEEPIHWYPIIGNVSSPIELYNGATAHHDELSSGLWSITNRQYSNGIRWPRYGIQNIDRYVSSRLPGLISTHRSLANRLLYNVMTTPGNGPDGVAFYGTTHPYKDVNSVAQTQSNQVTGGGVANVGAVQVDFEKAIAVLQKLRVDGGEFAFDSDSMENFTVVCGPDPFGIIRLALFGAITGNTSNTTITGYGDVKIKVNSRITDNDWYVVFTGNGLMLPFIHQEQFAPILEDVVYDDKQSEYRVKAVSGGAVGLGNYRSIAKINN